MHLRLIRHATLVLTLGPHKLLVDPMLDPAEAREPIPGTPHERRNPLVELPEPAEATVEGVTGVFVTHLHEDHLDATARSLLPEVPVFCQPEDAEALRALTPDVRPVVGELEWDGIRIVRTGGRHGTGELGASLGPVSGFVLVGEGEPLLYVAGDTIWGPEVQAALDDHEPDLVVLNAGGARFAEGDPVTMTAEDVVAVARHAPQARVIAVHLEAMNHCVESRADLTERLHAEALHEQVTVPDDGAEVPVMAVGG